MPNGAVRRIWFDLESTGVDPDHDRIVEIAFLEVPGNRRFHTLVNPGIPIPGEATEVHGIEDEHVAGEPGFEAHADMLQQVFAAADVVLCTYNGYRFDVPLLDAELRRAGQPGLPRDEAGRIDVREIDLYQVWRRTERRNLEAAAERFAGTGMTGGQRHTSEADTLVLPKILAGMGEQFGFDPEDTDRLCEVSRPEGLVDRAGKFRKRDGAVVFNFGQHRGEEVRHHLDYLEWMISRDFPSETVNIARFLLRHYQRGFRMP